MGADSTGASWLPLFSRIADEVAEAVAAVWGTVASRQVQGIGAGGDGTVYIDSLAEEIVLRALQGEHNRGRAFTVISEEIGERDFGRGGDVVVVDPIDGSHNAKMGIPYFSLVLAAAKGRDFGSVHEAMVRNLVTGETYAARRGGGATRNGVTISAGPGLVDGRLNVVQIEGTAWEKHSWRYPRLFAEAEKVRILGSAALNLCLCATGALSLSVAPSLRSVDCVGPLLILEEAGGAAADFGGGSLVGASLELTTRVPVVAGASRAAVDRGLELMAASPVA